MNSLLAQAHKALNGDLKNTYSLKSSDKYLFLSPNPDEYITYKVKENGMVCEFQYICTVEEFNNYKGDNMKTVKHFKDLGLEFINGDMIHGETGNTDSAPISLLTTADMDILGIEDVAGCWTIAELAWRTNTGEKPSFTGDIEFKFNNREPEIINNSATDEYFWMECPASGRITHWRPLLDSQPKAADKALLEKGESMEIDYTSPEFWKDAPEGAEIYIKAGDNYIESFIKDVTTVGYSLIDMEEINRKWIYQEAPLSLIDELVLVGIPRPKPSPVYTQAMHDNGDKPSVGMECMIKVGGKGSWTEFTPHYFGRKYVIGYWKANDREASFAIGALEFKPIDTRTDKEKAGDKVRGELVSGECYQFSSPSGVVRKGYYIPVKEQFICANGNIDASRASNIQKLTVEVTPK